MVDAMPGLRYALIGARTASALREASSFQRPDQVRLDRVTPRLVAETMVDELASSIFARGDRSKQRAQLIQANEDADVLYNLIRLGTLPAEPADFHQAPPAPRTVETSTVRSRRRDIEHLTFPSRFTVPAVLQPRFDAWQANQNVHAYVLRGSSPDRPWLINVHGHRQGVVRDLTTFRAAGHHAKFDLNVMHPVLPHHGVRRDDSSPEPPPGIDFSLNVFGIAQSVWDVRRCIRHIRAQSDAPIIMHGISLGAYVASLVVGLDDDVDAVVAGVPVIDFPAIMLEHARRLNTSDDDTTLLAGETVRAIHHLISPLGLGTRVPIERRYIYAGLVDRVSAPGQALTLWRHWGCPTIEWYQGGHVGHIWDSAVWNMVERAIEGAIS